MDKDVRLLLAHCLRTLAIGVLIWPAVEPAHAAPQHGPVISVPDSATPISISGQYSQAWEDDDEQVLVARGNCRVSNGTTSVSGQQFVVWQRPTDTGHEVVVYGEQLQIVRPDSTRSEPAAMLIFSSDQAPTAGFTRTLKKPARHEAFFQRAIRYRRGAVPGNPQSSGEEMTVGVSTGDLFAAWQPALPQSTRRVRIRPRTSTPFEFRSHRSSDTIPAEQIAEIDGGVNVVIDGFTTDVNGQQVPLGVIDLSADRMVIWTVPSDDLRAGQFTQARETPFQVYMEGNIEIRQGGNILTATHGFFDVQNDRALLLNGELRAYLPAVDGQVRVRAERIRQTARSRFHAQNAWVTTSPYGKPGYRLEASDIFVEPRSTPAWIRPRSRVDPQFGLPNSETLWITSLNNRLVIGETPVFSYPRLSGPAEDPGIPIRSGSVRHDRILGLQVKTVWDLTRLMGMDKMPGLQWDLLADYYSQRGPGLGTGAQYEGISNGPLPGHYIGEGLLYYINDGGKDTLGLDRRGLATDNNRGRAQWRHRQELPGNIKLFGELGYLSDRNYLEQYAEQEFDEGKDVETLIRIKQDVANWSGSLLIRPQVNNFEATTEWLPRVDLYGLSEPLFGGALTWSSHTSLGYGRLNPAEAPGNPADVFSPVPYVAGAEGLVTMSRHEVDAPMDLGPIKFTPFVMGEVAHWDEGLTGDSVNRAVVSGGARASMMLSRVYPFFRSDIFNVNGLAHKIEYNVEARITDSTEDLSSIPLYNEIDDNAQERFRYRLLTNTFGGTLPAQFDPRSFALRNGTGFQLSAPFHELVDDQQVVRMSVRHRLQTKVGPAANPRIRDWMIFETGFAWFPKADRDNFGEDFGLYYTRYQWHVGERTSLIANTLWDTFDGGQQVSNVGILSQRSRQGSIYVGYRSINGTSQLDSDIVTASFSYAMGPKWVATAGTAYDFGENLDRGQSLTISRIGLDWIFHMGANYDRSKNNAGVALMLEPRFGSGGSSPVQLNSLLGVR